MPGYMGFKGGGLPKPQKLASNLPRAVQKTSAALNKRVVASNTNAKPQSYTGRGTR